MSRDLRRYADQTTRRLIAGVVLIFFLIGGGLIYIFYGEEAAFLGITCLVAGLAPLLLITLIFRVMDWIVKRERDQS